MTDDVNTDKRGDALYILLALLIGITAGVIGSIFHILIDFFLQWPHWIGKILHGWQLVLIASLITMTCTLISVFLVRRFAPEASGSGVQEIEGAMENLRVVRWRRILPVKFFAGLIAMAGGLVLGREGPTIHIGAAVAAGWSGIVRISDIERRGLLAAGAAAGLACAFNAPFAAMIFVIEETRKQFPYSFRTYAGVIVASIAATVMVEQAGGVAPDLKMTVAEVELSLLPAFIPLGIIIGVVGVALNASIMHMLDFSYKWQKRAPYLYPALVGLAVGALLIFYPMTVTGGDKIIQHLEVQHYSLIALLLISLARFVTMTTSYSSGVPGGIFAPILSLAICIGLAFGMVLDSGFPDLNLTPMAFGVAAMAGLFTASVGAPSVGVILILELTGTYNLMLPVLITCVIAQISARWLGGRPIYDLLLELTLSRAKAEAAGVQVKASCDGTVKAGA